MSDSGKVNIHGKEYKTVAYRINEFRGNVGYDYGIETEVLSAADLVQVKAIIKSTDGQILATGLAEEVRGSTNINKTSALENAETSAVGRALAFLGYGGTEIASADEVANAITQQKEMEAVERLKVHNKALRDNLPSILAIKEALRDDAYSTAKECWQELSEDEQRALWISPTAGGVLTTEERSKMKSNEWHEA